MRGRGCGGGGGVVERPSVLEEDRCCMMTMMMTMTMTMTMTTTAHPPTPPASCTAAASVGPPRASAPRASSSLNAQQQRHARADGGTKKKRTGVCMYMKTKTMLRSGRHWNRDACTSNHQRCLVRSLHWHCWHCCWSRSRRRICLWRQIRT